MDFRPAFLSPIHSLLEQTRSLFLGSLSSPDPNPSPTKRRFCSCRDSVRSGARKIATTTTATTPVRIIKKTNDPDAKNDHSITYPASSSSSRRVFLQALSVFLLGGGFVQVARAEGEGGEVGEAAPKKKGKRGTKEEKAYQLCLSQCLYDCTTPKAGAAKERGECFVECKDECARTPEQL